MRIIKTNGDIIECSVEEYEYLLGRERQIVTEEIGIPEDIELPIEEEPIEYVNPIKKLHKIHPSSCERWSRHEEKLLLEKVREGVQTKDMTQFFPGRTECSLAAKRAKLLRATKRKYHTNPVASKHKSDRMKFINQRANEIWNANGKKDRKKALELAMFEWNLNERAAKTAGVENV